MAHEFLTVPPVQGIGRRLGRNQRTRVGLLAADRAQVHRHQRRNRGRNADRNAAETGVELAVQVTAVDRLDARFVAGQSGSEVRQPRIVWVGIHPFDARNGRRMVHEIIRRMINDQVADLVNNTRQNLARFKPGSINDVRALAEPMVCFSAEMCDLNLQLKQFLRKQLYQHYRVQRMSNKAGRVIRNLFDAFMAETKMLPPEQSQRCELLESSQGEVGRARAVADYVAGMTDRYAIVEHDRIFDPSALT